MSDMDETMDDVVEDETSAVVVEETVDETPTAPMAGIPANSGTTEYAAAVASVASGGGEQSHHEAGPGGATGARLRSFIERVERLEEEKAALAEDIKEVFGEAKSDGFDVKIIRQILKIRKMDDADRAEQEALLETYMSAIGM